MNIVMEAYRPHRKNKNDDKAASQYSQTATVTEVTR